jgi:regulator of vacuolar morphogenesis
MSEVIQAIFIRECESRATPKPHTAYKIEVNAAVRNWLVWKRYSEFYKLDLQFQSIFPKNKPPVKLPPKRYFPSTFSDPEKIEERKRGLEAYLRGILSCRDDRWRLTDVWREFLSIPTGKSLESTSYTLESWLDEYTAMSNTAREIRSLINKRSTHIARNEISASHNCTVQAKKLLMNLSSRLSSLESGLTGLSNANTLEGGMSEGELRRRQDMLTKLKDEKEALMKLASTGRQDSDLFYNTKPTAPMSNIGDRRSLLGDNKSDKTASFYGGENYGFPEPAKQEPPKRANTIGNGRALGAAAKQLVKETEVTRGLDNQGLLQNQQQLMSDQDSQVQQFSSILARQKQIGIAIGHELETQNQILDELDGDVGRTQTKLKYAGKKLQKIK